ncbi:related to transaldolase [Phialocephala subalpina]|uniref:Transaldolase n=1 Tax=Phialocephala subalpina TaxID=576137 RepID=A0A1L7WG18_9HELO|nr:related to transaldolase [Phialocephala subalpina]
MAPAQNLLQLLQSRTIVDCDTMDVEVPKTLGKFVDCTSNQAIAYFELQKPIHKSTIEDSISLAKTLSGKFPEISVKELAVEIAMVKLQLAISYHVSGYVHVQTNPYYSYSTPSTITAARRIVQLFKYLDSAFDTGRVCIKIPSTWEGLQACRVLQESGTATLATALFVIEQAALAGEVGCRYIAPYVNELKVHFEAGFVDHNKAQRLCLHAQRLYEQEGFKTQVLPASLTSTDEIMALAGVHHITIAPGLLKELAEKPASELSVASLFDEPVVKEKAKFVSFKDREAEYRIAFTRSGNGEGERKLGQAINIFCDMQDKIEGMMIA